VAHHNSGSAPFRHVSGTIPLVFAIALAPGLSGCTMFDAASHESRQPAPLSWLTNWVSQPMEVAPAFDVESIRPAERAATVAAGDLLEITVWDLYELGKPYSYPVRVSPQLSVEAPLLGEIAVQGQTVPQVEAAVAAGLRTGEYLLNPRVLVRSLDPPTVKVQVMGAVSRPGYVELPRHNASVYAAIISAGGLKKTAGTQVGVARRSQAALALAAQGSIPAASTSELPSAEPVVRVSLSGSASSRPLPAAHEPALRANSVDELSVPPASPSRPALAPSSVMVQGGLFAVNDFPGHSQAQPLPATGGGPATVAPPPKGGSPTFQSLPAAGAGPAMLPPPPKGGNPVPSSEPGHETAWFDVSAAGDREQLKSVQLAEGDLVVVKSATPPLRIGGTVNHPGAYPLPAGRSLNVWQAIEMAGGIRGKNVPLNLTLLHPAAEGHAAQRWYLNVDSYDQHPAASPFVEPGDVLNVQPTTGGKIKRVVGDLWSKP
jgi:protein involved in polysaccharide export with SLBB domain